MPSERDLQMDKLSRRFGEVEKFLRDNPPNDADAICQQPIAKLEKIVGDDRTNSYPPKIVYRCVSALHAVDYRQSSGDLDWRIVTAILDALSLNEVREALAGAILEHDAGGITLATARQIRAVAAKLTGDA